MIKNCAVCGGEFVAKGSAKTCSSVCRTKRSREQVRLWRLLNPIRMGEISQRWREKNVKKARESGRRSYAKHREKYRENNRQRYAKNSEKLLEKSRNRNIKISAALQFLKELETKGIGALL